ncbi:hypothetical protein SUGI_0198200 [Cryptomeria japonica]|nr:hypothetical protein SUGI_0198200 [Cryptomeria japonica]
MKQSSVFRGIQREKISCSTSKPVPDGFTTQDKNDTIKTLCTQGRLKEALDLLTRMEWQEIQCSTYACILQVCGKSKGNDRLSEVKLVHAHIIHTGLTSHRFVANGLLNVYAKHKQGKGSVEDARKVFDQMIERDICSWSVIIAAYSRHGSAQAKQGLELFGKMQRSGFQANEFTFASVISACAKLTDLAQGMEVHKGVVVCGYESDVTVANALVDMYAKCGNLDDARKVFDRMSQRNAVSQTAMFTGYAQKGFVDEALGLFWDMPERDVASWTAMVAGLVQNGRSDEALELFRVMPEQDVASWTVMIAGLAQDGRSAEALELYREMQAASDTRPDAKTFSSVLPACANLAALEQGMEIHEEIIRSGFQSAVFVESALVDMYAKCGNLEKAREVFDKMSERDVVAWTTIIEGYAGHGLAKEAIKLFEQMQHQSGIIPNRATFVSILSACCRAGLVSEGKRYFECMSRDYNVTPEMQHYACIVDLLGRAGHLDKAEEFINKMPIRPDATVWRSLLAACRIHNNIDLGERVAAHLFELEPKNVGPYVLLSNMYAVAERWDDAENMRKIMKEVRIESRPGWSWIEVNKQVYAFLAGDRLHPHTEDIFADYA